MAERHTIIVFTRYPEPGRAKTRLIPALGPQKASDLQHDMTMRTLLLARNLSMTRGISVEAHFDGGSRSLMEQAYGPGVRYVRQVPGDLGARMRSSFCRAFRRRQEKVVLIGTDCPGLSRDLILEAFAALRDKDCVLGPASDGGYYLIGLKKDLPGLFDKVPWSDPRTLEATLDAAQRLGLGVRLLEELRDVDRQEDLSVWDRVLEKDHMRRISAVIPALDEGPRIRRTLESLMGGTNVEVIVADAGSADETVDIARASGAKVISAQKGRASQMNEGACHASGRILFFVHADTVVPPGYDRDIRFALKDDERAAGAFGLRFDASSVGLTIIEKGADMRNRMLRLPYGDQGLFMPAGFFHELGGFPDMPILEDVAIVSEIRKKGRLVILPARVTTSARRYEALGVFRTWLMNQLVYAGYFLKVPLATVSLLYRSRASLLRHWAPLYAVALKDLLLRGLRKEVGGE